VTSKELIPVILCGGTGSRLWPLSRASYPKQYWDLYGESQESLLQQTQKRLDGLKGILDPILICHEDHRFVVAEQMREIDVEPNAIMLEPVRRNTAPAICIAALKATELGKDPLLLVLSADHVIRDESEFLRVVEAGYKNAEEGELITFGIVPTKPETGYGYIEASEELKEKELNPIPISRFIEKPNKEEANKYLLDSHFTWNSGIFLFKASTILRELENYVPNLVSSCRAAIEDEIPDLDFFRIEREAFSKCPNISIDVAVMERTNLGAVLPLKTGWSDIGSWGALWETAKKDEHGNAMRGKVMSMDCKNCYLRSEQRLVVGIGVENLIVVETDDAVLVVEKSHDQSIKKIVNQLEKNGSPEATAHRKIYRPWGNYTEIIKGNRWQVKKIKVKPNASLSLQMHHHRAEHWIVVKGTALVEIDGKEELLGENQSTYIPLGCKHRLTNPGRMPMELIEVQSGTYLGEDDIVRFEDRYGRIEEIKKNLTTQQ
tara:strand:+ start:1212 stop:2681 length:1470 start_codon:yes stop_codon:yes gene_type:complete